MPRRNLDLMAGVTGDDEDVLHVEQKGDVTRQAFGSPPPPPPSPNEVAKPLPIDQVLPYFAQPRRILPSAVARLWNRTPIGLAKVFGHWWGMAQEEMGVEFDLARYVLDDGYEVELPVTDLDSEEQNDAFPISMRLLRLANFARTIRREGQINPIKVVRSGQQWVIEIGERRWMTRHLLRWLSNGQNPKWDTILAVQQAQFSLERQAVENANREELNAIARARNLALLLIAEYGQQNFHPLEDYLNNGVCDRAFYAQVADGDQFRIPKGKSETYLSLMALKDPVQLRQYRALLRLPDEIWVAGDDQNWVERRLREYVSSNTVTAVTVSKTTPTPTLLDDPAVTQGKALLTRQDKAIFRELMMLKSGVGQAQPHTKEQLRVMLDAAEKAISSMKKLL